MIELLNLTYVEGTENYHLFKITIKETIINIFSENKKKLHVINCSREKHHSQTINLDNGKSLYLRWLYIDNSINAILETKSKCYIK